MALKTPTKVIKKTDGKKVVRESLSPAQQQRAHVGAMPEPTREGTTDMEALQVELDRVKNVAKAREQAVEKLTSELEATKEQVTAQPCFGRCRRQQPSSLRQALTSLFRSSSPRVAALAQVVSFLAKNKEKDKQIKGLKQRFDEAEKEHKQRMESMAAQMRAGRAAS